MRCALILAMFAASLVHAAWSDYEEVRNLELDAAGLQSLRIDAGAGTLEVVGVAGADSVQVKATVAVPESDAEQAKQAIASDMVLTLVERGSHAVLTSRFESGWRLRGDSPVIHLEIRVPASLTLDVADSSGSITISGVHSDISVDDSSGSIRMHDVGGTVRIDDGSGSVSVSDAHGDLHITDGSGSIDVRNVTGSVIVDDGSGSVSISDVGGDLIVEDDGSGSLRYSNIAGRVENGSR